MINLGSSIASIRVNAAVGPLIEYVTSWAEFNDLESGNNSCDLQSAFGAIAGVTTIVPPPADGRQRQVKNISIINRDTVDFPMIVEYFQALSTPAIIDTILKPGYSLHYNDCEGWYLLDPSANRGIIDTVVAAQQQISRLLLSGSTSGRPIAVAATATPGTLIHTAVTGTVSFDEIWLWVTNRTAAAATLTIEWGGTGTGDQLTQALSIPANSSPILVVQGEVLNNSLIVRAFSGTANALNISGYVNRIV